MDFFSFLQNDLNISLNEQQKAAVTADDRRILLEACPGSGKTTTLVARVAYRILYRKMLPSDMLTLTFSRASARDMERRFGMLFGAMVKQPVHFSTIHSFCYRFMHFCGRKGVLAVPELIENQSGSGKFKILRDLYFRANSEYLSEDQLEQLSNEIGYVKNKMLKPEQFKSEFDDFSLIFRRYEEYKKEHRLIDFDDMLSITYDLLLKDRGLYRQYGQFTHVHVDEVQDTSLLQHRIIEELSRQGTLFMVGDTDQSIYGFRGAEPEAIVNIREMYPDTKILRLEANYRSGGNIVRLADLFIRQNVYRHPKNMFTDNEAGEEPVVHQPRDLDEQLQIILRLIEKEKSLWQTAVLFRNNLSGLPVIWQLIQKGLPFHIREDYSSFFRHFVVADVFAFFSLAVDPCDMESFRKIYYKMGAPISKNELRRLEEELNGNQPQPDILTLLLQMNHHRRHLADHLVRIRRGLHRMARSNPYQALEILESELQYGDYLKRNAGFRNVFHTLKHFARNTKNTEELKTRLRTLKNGVDQACGKAPFDAVHLLTLHGSKGLEFDTVILIDLVEGEFPDEKSVEALQAGDRKAYEEEMRLFYVGVTRARKRVHLISPRRLQDEKTTQSRFVRQFLQPLETFELEEGQVVRHTKFGEGVVKSCNNGVAEILFRSHGSRRLSVKVCMESGMLKVLHRKHYDGAP